MDIGQANDVMDSLALMPDPALQQYAQMHKDDPYVMALALSESNRRKKLRAAKQGQAGQMPQPKVVDQAIQAINPPPQQPQQPQQPPMPQQGMQQPPQAQQQLPEQQGVAQLPAPNMQAMADGGIAGYDDAPGFADGVVMMNGKAYVRNPFTGKLQEVEHETPKPGLSDLMQKLSDYSNRNANNPAAMAPTAPPPPPPPPPPPAPAAIPRSAGPSMGPGSMQPPPQPTPKAPPSGPAAGPALPGLSVANLKNEGMADEGRLQSYLSGARSDLAARLPADAEANKDLAYFTAQRKAQMPEGEAYDKYQASLEKEAADEPAEKEKAGLMALTKGFLMVAAGESPHALQNFAKGMGVGLDEYSGAIKEFRKAGKERQKQLGDIEQARRAEKRGDVDKAAEYMEKAKDREGRRQTTLASGMAQLDTAGAHGIASLMGQSLGGQFSLLGTQMQGQNAMAVARFNATAPGQTERIIDRMGDPAFATRAKGYLTMGPEAKGMEAELKAYIANPMIIKATNPALAKQFDDIIASRLKGMSMPGAVKVPNALP